VITFATSGNINPFMTRPKAFIKANKIKCSGNHSIYLSVKFGQTEFIANHLKGATKKSAGA
jgi:hypothetical protein